MYIQSLKLVCILSCCLNYVVAHLRVGVDYSLLCECILESKFLLTCCYHNYFMGFVCSIDSSQYRLGLSFIQFESDVYLPHS